MSTIFQGLNRTIDRPLFSRMVVGVSLATVIALGLWMAFEIDADVNRRAAQVNKFCESLERIKDAGSAHSRSAFPEYCPKS
ncbi:hypothetical protein [Pseudomonas putida]|uniref:Uncharacterized protein n=1 Tax=Pseudomonas putida TaxID=303 RepID=A0A8I1EIM9_PSEPU|nr:hypothetical protein [Pseudomonas putida]MBI6885823.1 hypothetical protein [Pseudomonas putida]